jgi:DnaK suppressor protein
MSQNKWDKYKQLLLSLKEQILKGGYTTRGEDLEIPPEELSDEADLANSVIAQQVSFQIRDREMSKLRFINMALERIENDSYGHCEDCNTEISAKRLMNQPWTEYCIDHAEEREREQKTRSA